MSNTFYDLLEEYEDLLDNFQYLDVAALISDGNEVDAMRLLLKYIVMNIVLDLDNMLY